MTPDFDSRRHTGSSCGSEAKLLDLSGLRSVFRGMRVCILGYLHCLPRSGRSKRPLTGGGDTGRSLKISLPNSSRPILRSVPHSRRGTSSQRPESLPPPPRPPRPRLRRPRGPTVCAARSSCALQTVKFACYRHTAYILPFHSRSGGWLAPRVTVFCLHDTITQRLMS